MHSKLNYKALRHIRCLTVIVETRGPDYIMKRETQTPSALNHSDMRDT